MTTKEAYNSPYTLLETLLLFHNLSTHGTHVSSFQLISGILLKNPLVYNDRAYDHHRLSPDALREHYLDTLKEEGAEGAALDGNGESAAPTPVRKRKGKAKTPPTSDNLSVINKLTSQFYALYKKAIISRIREDEKKILHLQWELKEITTGSWDERLERELHERTKTESRTSSVPPPPTERRKTLSPVVEIPIRRSGAEQPGATAATGRAATPGIGKGKAVAASAPPKAQTPPAPIVAPLPEEQTPVEPPGHVSTPPVEDLAGAPLPQTVPPPVSRPRSPDKMEVEVPPPQPPVQPNLVLPPAVPEPNEAHPHYQRELAKLAAGQTPNIVPVPLDEAHPHYQRELAKLAAGQTPNIAPVPLEAMLHKAPVVPPASLPAQQLPVVTPAPPISVPPKARRQPPKKAPQQKQQKQKQQQKQQQKQEQERLQQEQEQARLRQQEQEQLQQQREEQERLQQRQLQLQEQEQERLHQQQQQQQQQPQTVQQTPSELVPAQKAPPPQQFPPSQVPQQVPPPEGVPVAHLGPVVMSVPPPSLPPTPVAERQKSPGSQAVSPSRQTVLPAAPRAVVIPPPTPQADTWGPAPPAPPPPAPPAVFQGDGLLELANVADRQWSNSHLGAPVHQGPPFQSVHYPPPPPVHSPHPMIPGASGLPPPMLAQGTAQTLHTHQPPQGMAGFGIIYPAQSSPEETPQPLPHPVPHQFAPPLAQFPHYPHQMQHPHPLPQLPGHQMLQSQHMPQVQGSPRKGRPPPISTTMPSTPIPAINRDRQPSEPGSPVQPGSADISPISTPPNSPPPKLPTLPALPAKPVEKKGNKKRPLEESETVSKKDIKQPQQPTPVQEKPSESVVGTPSKKIKSTKDPAEETAARATPTAIPSTRGRGGTRGRGRGTKIARSKGRWANHRGRGGMAGPVEPHITDQSEGEHSAVAATPKSPTEPTEQDQSEATPEPPVESKETDQTKDTPKPPAKPKERDQSKATPKPKEKDQSKAMPKVSTKLKEKDESKAMPKPAKLEEKEKNKKEPKDDMVMADAPTFSQSPPPETPQAAPISRKRKAVVSPEQSDTEDENIGNNEPEPSPPSPTAIARPPLPTQGTSASSFSFHSPINLGVSAGQQPMVVATKKFAQLTTPLIGNILSHKFANLFSFPVSERQVPGYKTLVYTPQDLKSIKAAVKAGAASLLTLPTTNSTAGTPTTDSAPVFMFPTTSTSTSITTLATTANTPPRGIVNSLQLEKELFRMFANAVMYNKTTTDIVKETIEMSKDVQQMVDNFRTAEEAGAKKALAAGAAGKNKQIREDSMGEQSVVASSVVGEGETNEGSSVVEKGKRGRKKKVAVPPPA